jgi:hypothetical protein
MKKITITNVLQFIEGNAKAIADSLNLLPDYYKEQVVWRMNICKDSCINKNNECEYCGCTATKKLYVEESCNDGEKFPNLMTKEEWKKYKEENDIEIYV